MRKNRKIFLIVAPLLLLGALVSFKHQIVHWHDVKQPNIVINSMMKCGSTYVTKSIQKNLGYERFKIPHSQDLAKVELNDFFQKDRRVLKLHVMPDAIDWNEYKTHSDQIIIQIRDPRQAILSWTYHMKLFIKRSDNFVPKEFYDYDLNQQIDWVIEHKLPEMVKFIDDWLEFKERQDKQPNGIKVLIATYDELLKSEQALIEKILNFYNIDYNYSNYQSLPKDRKVLYRKADSDEWRTVFNETQKRRVAQVVSSDLLKNFGWKI